jgi:hypothetical protein
LDKYEMNKIFLSENMKGRDHLGDLYVKEKIILK